MDALTACSPAAARALGEVERATWHTAQTAGIGDLTELVSRVCAAQVGLAPLDPGPLTTRGRWADADPVAWRAMGNLSSRDAVALRFAEQFSVDVSSITPELRSEFFAEFGKGAGDFAALVYVVDFLPRSRAALETLVGEESAATPRDMPAEIDEPGIWEALDQFTRVVPALDSLDPVLTELVRLRGARQHRCRLCASLRSRPALLAGADESTFATVLGDGLESLGPVQRAAIGFTDAMIWTPGTIPPETVSTLRAELTDEQRVELVLDVTRNALNKVAVALGSDAPHVESGVEIYDVDPDGNLLYGLSLD